ncbi:hypothetical protein [Streptomyces sp. NPDC054854]
MPTTVFDQLTRRTADVTAQLAILGIPLTALTPPSSDPDPTDPWACSHTALVDRSTLAWCTAVQMLAKNHGTGIDRQILAADALLRELGVRGLAKLHSDLHHGAPSIMASPAARTAPASARTPPDRTAMTPAAPRSTSSTATSTCARYATAPTISPSGSPKST